MSTIGIVIPAYRPDIPTLTNYAEQLWSTIGPQEIRIELDDPGDHYGPDRLSIDYVTINRVMHRRGKGAAITDGFESLPPNIDLYVTLDADGSTSAEAAMDLIRPIQSGEFDIAVGSRRHPDSSVSTHQTRVRRHLGNIFAFVGRRFLPITLYDYQCGAKVISANAWKRIRNHLFERGFAWDIEVVSLASVLDITVVEIPIKWEDKPGSTVDIGDAIFDLTRALVTVRHRCKALEGHPIHARFPPSYDDALIELDRGDT